MTAMDLDDAEEGVEGTTEVVVGSWPHRLRNASNDGAPFLGHDQGWWRDATRRELRLPTDRPLIGAGHQANFWHPGVAMKLVAADEIARLVGGSFWHLVVDSDAHPIGRVSVPIRDTAGLLREIEFELARDAAGSADVPTGRRRPLELVPSESLPSSALPSIDAGLRALHAALRDDMLAGGATDAAMQVTHAAIELLSPLLHSSPTIVRSSALLQTTLGAALLDAMRDDPRRCAESYNDAIAETHHAATLLTLDGRVELPLWRIDERGARHRACADDLEGSARAGVLLPRALLVTAITRLAAADLFVHGTGGIAYDVAMERWVGDWIGATPSPACLTTATLHLPLPERDLPPDAVPRAIAALRRRWWDPQPFVAAGASEIRHANDSKSADLATAQPASKQSLIRAIAAAPRNSRERAERFRELHRTLDALRERAAPAIDEANRAVDDARRLAAGRPIAMSRTWPFPYHEATALARLADDTRAAVRAARR